MQQQTKLDLWDQLGKLVFKKVKENLIKHSCLPLNGKIKDIFFAFMVSVAMLYMDLFCSQKISRSWKQEQSFVSNLVHIWLCIISS